MLRHLTITLLFLYANPLLYGRTDKAALSKPAREIKTLKEYKELCQQDKPFVIMFYAPWCGACNSLKEPFNEASMQDDVILVKINIDNPDTKSLKESLCISAVPTFITRKTGAVGTDILSNIVNSHVPQKTTKDLQKLKS